MAWLANLFGPEVREAIKLVASILEIIAIAGSAGLVIWRFGLPYGNTGFLTFEKFRVRSALKGMEKVNSAILLLRTNIALTIARSAESIGWLILFTLQMLILEIHGHGGFYGIYQILIDPVNNTVDLLHVLLGVI